MPNSEVVGAILKNNERRVEQEEIEAEYNDDSSVETMRKDLHRLASSREPRATKVVYSVQ